MKRSIFILAIVAAVSVGVAAYYIRSNGAASTGTADGQGQPGGRGAQGGGPGGGFGGGFGGFGGGGGGGPRLPMTVELASVKRADMAESIQVVGNLIGAATVTAVPKISGRLETVSVRLGDRVSRGQRLAKIEDAELREQVKQAEASFAVGAATIRQREADLRLAQTNLERSRNLFERQLIPKQTYDDTEARHQAAVAQVDLAQAQYAQAQARLDELKINLSNTIITSPVNGFVGSRTLDAGAWVTPNSGFISLVDISVVRLVANVVERDLSRIREGLAAGVEVDAYPGEMFKGRVAHVAPVLDPATRTAQIEVEIDNANFRLKPGMYAKVTFAVERRDNTLVVPATAVVDVRGSRGVFQPDDGDIATFKPITPGLVNGDLVEVVEGLSEGDRVVTTGAAALREGDRIVLAGQAPGEAGGRRGAPDGSGRGAGPGGARGSGEAAGAPVRPADGERAAGRGQS
jgi:RND family efflux transporter MFP subunit